MDGQAAGVDRISALPDDVLHVILGRLGYAPAVSKTAVLSRRWRHVWTRAKSLTFKDTDMFLINKSDFASFVDWVLAQRGNDADLLESLEIHVKGEHCTNGVIISPEKVNEWLRYAAQHVVGSVNTNIGCSPREEQAIVEVPSHGRAVSISLVLPDHRFQPIGHVAGARHEVLTKLQLFSLSFSEDGSELSEFVASCCPRLRRLFIYGPDGLHRLVLQSESLEDLAISSAVDLLTLDVQIPNLRVFYMCRCFTFRKIFNNCEEYVHDNKMVRIVAPKLEEIATMHNYRSKAADLDIHDLSSVRRLTNLCFDMHGKYHCDNDVGFWLFESCTNVEHVAVSLRHMPCANAPMDGLVDLTASEGKAPLGKVRSLAVRASHFPKRHLVGSMSSLLIGGKSVGS
nr:unnamed protein product [Digitaria exilis]